MIERLTIRDLALVERAEIHFGPGLHAVTGETGAGKSLIVTALQLVLGGRAEPDMIRQGAASALVEAEFRLAGETAQRIGRLLEEWGLEFDGETLVVRREIAEGRSRASVNQSPVTLASLRKAGEWLADLHGQHEHQSLLRPEAGVLTLDRLGGLEGARDAYGASLAAWREAEAELERLRASLATFAERSDYLRHAAAEIDAARLVDGEVETLAQEAARLAHGDRLRLLVARALDHLDESEGSAAAQLGAALHALEQSAALDPSLEEALPTLREAGIAVAEVRRSLVEYQDRLEMDPAALEAVEARRELLSRMERKFRRSIPELLEWRETIGHELATGEDAEGARERATERVAAAEQAARAAGAVLSRRRREAAAVWGPRITRELRPLGLGAATIAFEITTAADARPGPWGLDVVELGFTPNPGEPGRPLQRIASGGELSRVMLAFKVALESRDRVDLLVFDEVDSGIGGAVAQAVGERLRQLARHRQVVCVTHLPMIAALARHHLHTHKHTTHGRTVVRVEPVDGESRIAELARMLAGERVTETTRRQARELLASPRAE